MGALFIVSSSSGSSCWDDFSKMAPPLGPWAAFCRAVGLTADNQPAGRPQPPLRTPTRIAWTPETLARIASGNEKHGAFVALTCAGCHGEHGVSSSPSIPTLAGMNSAVIYKQLDDFRAGKRIWSVMNAMASA